MEHAVNSVVEAMVKKLFEVHDRLKQKESEFIQTHGLVVNELEKNILKQYENQSFSIEGETGNFNIQGLEKEKVVFMNEDKLVHIPLDKLDSIVTPIVQDKLISEETKENDDKSILNMEKISKFVEEFKGRSTNEINEKINDFEKECSEFYHNISYSEDPNMRANEHIIHDNMIDKLEHMKEAQKIVVNIRNIDLKDGHDLKNEGKKESEIKVPNEPVQKGNEFIKANAMNNNVSNKLEKNIERSISDLKSPFLLSSQIRGQMEVLNHLKSQTDKEILNNFKIAQKQARSKDKPVAEIYKENLQQKVNERVQFSKEKILNTAFNTFEKNQDSRIELREIEKEINKNMGTLYQAKLEQKITPEEYNQIKENLDQQKNKIDEKLTLLDKVDNKINEQLKVDLKQQFPEMKTDKLTLNESIGVAQAAYSMTNGNTVENLKNFSLANELNGVIQSIEKTTKEVEMEIEETIEVSFSR